jgi:hypothetical protein
MKLVNEKLAGQTVILPFVGENGLGGEVTYGKDGTFEVSDKVGKQILEAEVDGIRLFGKKTVVQEKAAAKKSDTQIQVDTAVANIKSMKAYKDLHQLCEDAKLPKEVWGEMKVPELKAYLIGKVAPDHEDAKVEEAPEQKEEAPKHRGGMDN